MLSSAHEPASVCVGAPLPYPHPTAVHRKQGSKPSSRVLHWFTAPMAPKKADAAGSGKESAVLTPAQRAVAAESDRLKALAFSTSVSTPSTLIRCPFRNARCRSDRAARRGLTRRAHEQVLGREPSRLAQPLEPSKSKWQRHLARRLNAKLRVAAAAFRRPYDLPGVYSALSCPSWRHSVTAPQPQSCSTPAARTS